MELFQGPCLYSENLTQSSNDGDGCHGESYLYRYQSQGSLSGFTRAHFLC